MEYRFAFGNIVGLSTDMFGLGNEMIEASDENRLVWYCVVGAIVGIEMYAFGSWQHYKFGIDRIIQYTCVQFCFIYFVLLYDNNNNQTNTLKHI